MPLYYIGGCIQDTQFSIGKSSGVINRPRYAVKGKVCGALSIVSEANRPLLAKQYCIQVGVICLATRSSRAAQSQCKHAA